MNALNRPTIMMVRLSLVAYASVYVNAIVYLKDLNANVLHEEVEITAHFGRS